MSRVHTFCAHCEQLMKLCRFPTENTTMIRAACSTRETCTTDKRHCNNQLKHHDPRRLLHRETCTTDKRHIRQTEREREREREQRQQAAVSGGRPNSAFALALITHHI